MQIKMENWIIPDYLLICNSRTKIIQNIGQKDNVPYGTYIEVDAYYRSINEEKVGSGDIKYRFMLGKKHYNKL